MNLAAALTCGLNPKTGSGLWFPPGEGAQALGLWVLRRPRGRGYTDDPGGFPGGSDATLGDLNREAGEGWLSACSSSAQLPLSPSPAKHSLESQRRDVQPVPAGLHAEARARPTLPGTDAPFVAPQPYSRRNQTDRHQRGNSTP